MYDNIILSEHIVLEGGFKKNMNCLVLGVPGSGKTRGHILPNLCNMQNSSAVLLDPKGELYSLTSNMMRERGFDVKLIDFDNPHNPDSAFYNPLNYCRTSDDILSITKVLLSDEMEKTVDQFWPNAAQLMANALIGYLVYETRRSECTLESLIKLLKSFEIPNDPRDRTTLDIMFGDAKNKSPNAWHVEQYELLRKIAGAEKTYACIAMSLITAFASIMSDGIKKLTSRDTLDIKSIGRKKTVVYVKSSDSDRSRDKLISILFQQIFKELFHEADSNDSHALRIHTHLYLDDLGTNLTIYNLDGYLAACRSREISVSVILQSVGQLKKQFGDAYTAILGSCASLVFLGSNDINTCHEMSLRLNKPLGTVLYKDMNDIFVFTQGENARKTRVYNIKNHPNYHLMCDFKNKTIER